MTVAGVNELIVGSITTTEQPGVSGSSLVSLLIALFSQR